MVTRYDVISSRWSSHFWVKVHVFSTSFRNKSTACGKMMQRNYLCLILHVKRKKLLILTVFTWFLIREKIQDGDYVWWRHRQPTTPLPIKYTSSYSLKKIKGFPLKAKSFRNTATHQKLNGGGGSIKPFPLYHGGAMTLRVRPRVNKSSKKSIKWTCIENLIVKDFLKVRQVISQDERLLTTLPLEKGSQTILGYWFSTSDK